MAATAALPTLSQVQTLDTAYLREAAQYWTQAGDLWEQAFTEVHERMSAPGGSPWQGQAAAAAQERSYSDLVQVRVASDRLHGAAAVALRGDQQLQACKEGVLEAVQDARAEGFSVGEDYSVTDRLRGGNFEFRAARLAAAQGHASLIRRRVAALVTSDHELAARITAAPVGSGLRFGRGADEYWFEILRSLQEKLSTCSCTAPAVRPPNSQARALRWCRVSFINLRLILPSNRSAVLVQVNGVARSL